ncbi:hypothetical protein K505DRAFT_324692 [Melanomma pulvis-pyrius CBS 109.77]|uniref:Uncharacterized protein n=1 Tax=Melanomma pulvis-pyrius CBS 109.77 TaxID=1314802 RepID=A0A6A6XDI2_9PLEO|nr:hypothetical protein K505DRAFT_324692 [Melanomma pulvis-pyrius CBS 109.77]
MQLHAVLIFTAALSAMAIPIETKGSIERGAASFIKRSSPVPPLWDGGVDFEEDKNKRSSPVPPLWDGGVDFEAGK